MRLSRRGAIHSSGKGAVEVTFTGEHTETVITYNGESWRLFAMTSSGVLKASKEFKALLWMCSGGENGVNKKRGGDGAYFMPAKEVEVGKETVVVIAAGNSTKGTTFGNLTTDVKGSGGGAFGQGGTAGTGGGVSTIPFGDNTIFLKLCAGGGGGTAQKHGGVGGSNGSNGGAIGGYPTTGSIGNTIAGGADGGGHGGKKGNGNTRGTEGGDATAYGSGGGSAGAYMNNNSELIAGTDGKGYQGVAYLLLPLAA